MPPFIIISACLCGEPCRYDGATHAVERFVHMARRGEALPVCPEVLGGLGVPREPCEILHGRVRTRSGKDCTEAFLLGAAKTLELGRQHGIRVAILKERSPSCGTSSIYDGSFSGTRTDGQGLTAALLRREGLTLFSEENVPDEVGESVF
jgi:uncharacterized protein YbbK (DUF523 family)